MFEDSLFASRVGHVSSSRRKATMASICLQVAVAGVVIVVPLLHPDAVPFRLETPKVFMPPIQKPRIPVVEAQREASSSSLSTAVPMTTRPFIATLLPDGAAAPNDAPPLAPFGNSMGMPDGLPSGIGVGDGHGPAVSVTTPKPPTAPLHISSGVSDGMLLAPIRPAYPAIARAAHVEGSVVVEAVISKAGVIERLHVVSGPPMLQNAALDAIREARYRPYRLNGEPVEVQTTITVNFRIGG